MGGEKPLEPLYTELYSDNIKNYKIILIEYPDEPREKDDIHDYFMYHPNDLPRIKYLRLIEKFVKKLSFICYNMENRNWENIDKLIEEYKEKLK